jgi:ribonuclease T2
MRKILVAASMLVVAGCEPSAQAGAPSDSYVLALSWQPAFCETAPRRGECRSQTPSRPDARQFSLHGLWPQPGNRAWCTDDARSVEADKDGRWRDIAIERLDEPLWRRLQEGMPGTRSQLHRHEWIKHGTCMKGASAASYFETSLDLLDAVNASSAAQLFEDNIGRRLSAGQIRAAFDAEFGNGAGERVKISCEDDGNRRIISEITIGLKGALHGDIYSREELAALILASPPVDEGCPGGIVDRVGEQ